MNKTFKKEESIFLVGIASALGLRQFSLILAMPLLAVYGNTLQGATSALIGLAIGIYGLLQAILQVPYGILSDKVGRKPIILIGVFQLVTGLYLASIANNIYLLIAARALQGSGAIMAVAYSWISDVISETKRNEAMSIVGIAFGLAGTAGFIGAALLNKVLSVSQIFLLCSIFTVFTWIYIAFFVKEDKRKRNIVKKEKLKAGIISKDIIKLMSGGFFVYYSLVSVFIIVPQFVDKIIGTGEMWKLFIPATLLGIIAMRISARFADKGHEKNIVKVAFVVMIISISCLLAESIYFIAVGLILYFIGYMCLVTLFPATVTKLAPKNTTGSVTGIFNTVQFMGSFLGGTLTGILWGISKNAAVGVLLALCVVTMFIVTTVQRYSPEVISDSDTIDKKDILRQEYVEKSC